MLKPLLLLLFPAVLAANSFTVSTRSELDGTCSDSSTTPTITCMTASSTPNGLGGGAARAIAGTSAMFDLIRAEADVFGECTAISFCLQQTATADVSVKLAVPGPTGTDGLLEFFRFDSGFNGVGQASFRSTGLIGQFLGPHQGSLYRFTYDEPFTITLSAFAGCSECGLPFPPLGDLPYLSTSSSVRAPIWVYDMNLNLITTYTSIDQLNPAPEPSLLCFVGLMVIGIIKLHRG